MTKEKYHFERFSSEVHSFDQNFSDFLNRKYAEGWKYKDCQYYKEAENGHALCVFKRD